MSLILEHNREYCIDILDLFSNICYSSGGGVVGTIKHFCCWLKEQHIK